MVYILINIGKIDVFLNIAKEPIMPEAVQSRTYQDTFLSDPLLEKYRELDDKQEARYASDCKEAPNLWKLMEAQTKELHSNLERSRTAKIWHKLTEPESKVSYLKDLQLRYHLYKAVETRLSELKGHEKFKLFANEHYFRSNAIEKDLRAGGLDPDEAPPEAIQATLERIASLKPHQVIGHAFTSHLAPLFGGQIVVKRFQADTSENDWKELCNYYLYDPTLNTTEIKEEYIAAIKALELDDDEKHELIQAYRESYLIRQRFIDDSGLEPEAASPDKRWISRESAQCFLAAASVAIIAASAAIFSELP
jgi:heme oxygenase